MMKMKKMKFFQQNKRNSENPIFFFRKTDFFSENMKFSENLIFLSLKIRFFFENQIFLFCLFVDKRYLLIKVREVRIAKEVKRSDAGDAWPVAMFV